MRPELPTTPACSNRPWALPLSIKGPPRPPSRAGLFSAGHSARGTFVFQRVDNCPGLGAHDAVRAQLGLLLQLLHRLLGLGAESSVDAAHVEADGAHSALQAADRQAARAYPQHGLALVGFVDVDPGHSTDDSVRWDFPSLLEGFHGAFRARAEDTVDRAGIVAQSLERLLQVSHRGVVRPALQNRFGHDESLRYTVVNSARDARVAPAPPAGTHHVRGPTTPSSGSACCAW